MYHYKDCHPIKTINRIRGILETLGCMPVENRWINNRNKSYSVRLVISGTPLGSNGKGVTPELALASAYGEFMERIQNQFLYPLVTYHQYDTDLQGLHGFHSFPDEKYVSIQEFMETTDESILRYVIPHDLDDETPDVYLRSLSTATCHPDTGDLLCVPYYCINTDSLVYLPRSICAFVYGTNGMCAGNTPEEALVQGICEIIERYANKMVLINNLTPPEIERKYFSHFRQAGLVESLERNRIIHLILRDASLGEELPAVCIAVLNKELNKYFVKFASHIEFEVALERTLTELFQGRTIERLEKGDFMAPFEYVPDETYKSEENLFQIFGSGEGRYNNDFFGESPSYPIYEGYFNKKNLKGNREYLYYLIQNLLKRNWKILVRDVSFLGFPAFQIIIPGISELSTLHKRNCIDQGMKAKTSLLLRNINECTQEDLLLVAGVVEHEMKKDEHGNIADLTGILYLEGFPWKEINFNLFLCSLYLRMSYFEKSHHYMRRYLAEIEEKNIVLQPGGLNYYKCVRDYIALLAEKSERKIGVLKRIYGDEIVSEVVESIHPEKALQYYGRFECPQCPTCTVRLYCFYEKIRDIHIRIKNAMASKNIDQLNRNREFWSEFV
ncbi:MAG: YcaO-like family protein [Theionarchaea archaeon]|nr:YcaO-like family protein [Theionarchaea archaeon]